MSRRRLPPVRDLAPMAPPVTVIGDVHLTPEEPDVAERFLRAVDEVGEEGGTLILLGDLFDWWVGRRQGATPFAARVLERLARLANRGLRLAFLPGNRDYAFDGAGLVPLEVWPDVVRTRWGEATVVLSHGDLLCTEDRAYLRMRRLLRAAPVRAGLELLPLSAAAYLARGLRGVSVRAAARRDNEGARLGIDYGEARAWMEGYGADVLVVGHVHTGVHHRLGGEPRRDVLVLRDWGVAGNAVRFDGRRAGLVRLPSPGGEADGG